MFSNHIKRFDVMLEHISCITQLVSCILRDSGFGNFGKRSFGSGWICAKPALREKPGVPHVGFRAGVSRNCQNTTPVCDLELVVCFAAPALAQMCLRARSAHRTYPIWKAEPISGKSATCAVGCVRGVMRWEVATFCNCNHNKILAKEKNRNHVNDGRKSSRRLSVKVKL